MFATPQILFERGEGPRCMRGGKAVDRIQTCLATRCQLVAYASGLAHFFVVSLFVSGAGQACSVKRALRLQPKCERLHSSESLRRPLALTGEEQCQVSPRRIPDDRHPRGSQLSRAYDDRSPMLLRLGKALVKILHQNVSQPLRG